MIPKPPARPPADTSWVRVTPVRPVVTDNARRARRYGWATLAALAGYGLLALLVWNLTAPGQAGRVVWQEAQTVLFIPGTAYLACCWRYWCGRRDQEWATDG